MPDENDNSQSPQPILIQGGGIAPSENDPTKQENAPQPTPEESVESPDESQSNPTNYLAEAIERYEALEKEESVGNSFVILALLITAVSLLIGIPAVLDGLTGGVGDDGAAQLCCGGLFVAIVLGVTGGTQASVHEVKLKNAMKEVSDAVNYKGENDKNRHLVRALAFIGGGWLLNQPWVGEPITPFLGGVGVLLFCIGLLLLVYWLLVDAESNSKATKKKILDAARSQLRINEEE